GARAASRGCAGLGRRERERQLARGAAGRRAGAALPGRAVLRVPVALRGLRDPDPRGDGLRCARRDERGRRDGGGGRRSGRARRPARPGRDRARDRGGGGAARRAAPARARAGASRGLGGGRGANRRGVSRVLGVIDADSLGRQGTGDETYVAGLLGALPAVAEGLRIAAVTRRPDLVPAGVEPIALRARSQELRVAYALPRLLRRVRPALAHFLHVVPPWCPCPA